MREEFQENSLIELLKARKLSGKPIYIKRIANEEKSYIDIIRNFQGENYYSFQKNKNKIVVVKNLQWAYAPLLGIKNLNLELEKDFLKLDFTYDKEFNKIKDISVYLGKNYSIDNLGKINGTIKVPLEESIKVNIKEVVRISVNFISLIDGNTYNVNIPIKYNGVPYLNKKFTLKKTSKNYLMIYNKVYDKFRIEQIVKEMKEKTNQNLIFMEQFNDKEVLENLLNSYNNKNEVKINYKLITQGKENYFFFSLGETINFKDDEYFDKRINPSKKVTLNYKKNFSRKVLKAFYTVSGNKTYEKLLNYKRIIKSQKNYYLYYSNNFDKVKLDSNTFFISSINGSAITGNSFAIAKELSIDTKKKIYIEATKKEFKNIESKLKRYGIKAEVVLKNTKKYYKAILQSKFVISDSTLPVHYIKPKDQIYINTWHGTPLKQMGKKIKYSKLELANTQRNFLISNIISINNSFTIDILSEDYMIDKYKFELQGAPKIDLLLQNKSKDSKNKKVVWMPTWRGQWGLKETQYLNIEILNKVKSLTGELKTFNVDLYYKPHPQIKNLIDISDYKDINFVEDDIEIYDFLSDSDMLITDYSSILFDFAILNRPILLNWFDEEEYNKTRGMYISKEKLPFDIIKSNITVENILNKLNQKVNYKEFNDEFNALEKGNSTIEFLEKNIKNYKLKKKENLKEKVLIYPSRLKTNGISTALLNLLNNLDDTKRDYYILLPKNMMNGSVEGMSKIPEKYKYIASSGGVILTNKEAKIYRKFNNRITLTQEEIYILNNVYKREVQRNFGDLKFDYVVNFSGYEAYIAMLFSNMDSKKIVYVHNNMDKEYELRRNFHYQAIQQQYDTADFIRPVNNKLSHNFKQTEFMKNKDTSKVITAHNTVDFKTIKEKAKSNEPYMTEELKKMLEDKSIIKFVNIARFSPEKGIPRLIEAFLKLKDQNKNQKMKLILIGGPGIDSERIEQYVSNDILTFNNINPFPILKSCDLFVLSSFYEGLPMVFFESLVLGVPILSTAIEGPKEFLEQGYGNICEDSEEGILNGMLKYLGGELKESTLSLEEFNKKAIEEFYLNFK